MRGGIYSCCPDQLFPEALLGHPLLARLTVRFVPMVGDLLACSDAPSATVLLRQDISPELMHVAFVRELATLMREWGVDPVPERPGVVVPLRRRHGVG